MPDADLAEVLDALDAPGEILKEDRKGNVRRVGRWVIKESGGGTLATLKRTLKRARYRQAWRAAHHLIAQGVSVPAPVGFVEWRHAGVISRQAMISEYLEGERNAERFAVGLCRRGAGPDTLSVYLQSLAEAIRGLEAANVYHSDLSGKNIFTGDGALFTFIDLDAVTLGLPYTEERRLKNHVQLYDSFCDFIHERLLVPFMLQLIPKEIDQRLWLPRVRYAQEKRRHRLELKYARRGEVRPSPMDMPE